MTLWDAHQQIIVKEWTAVDKVEHFMSLDFARDSQRLATAGDHELVVWRIDGPGEVNRLHTFRAEGTTIRACCWSLDDAYLAIGWADATIHILHGNTFQEPRVLRPPQGARSDAADR